MKTFNFIMSVLSLLSATLEVIVMVFDCFEKSQKFKLADHKRLPFLNHNVIPTSWDFIKLWTSKTTF